MEKAKEIGTGMNMDTDQVPDASRITPEPVAVGTRSGHDISISVSIDTGGPGISNLISELHEIAIDPFDGNNEQPPNKMNLTLKKGVEIPNRDFVLKWRQTNATIEEGVRSTGHVCGFVRDR